MFSAKFISKPSKKDAVVVRITNKRRSAEVSLGIKATQEQLEGALSQKTSTKHFQLSKLLQLYAAKLEDVRMRVIQDNLTNTDARTIAGIVREAFFGPEEASGQQKAALGFAAFFCKRMKATKNDGYRATIEYTYKKIMAFCADKDSYRGNPFEELTFEDITLKWLNDFDDWLIDQGAAQNSRNIHFKNIRTVINRAIDEELTEKYPFRRFKIRPEATAKRSMTVENLRALFDYPVEEYQRFYLDMFKLTFMLVGINTTDLYGLKEVRDGRIEYRRAKTHRLYSIKVEPEAMEIIERWRGEKNLLCIADRWSNPRDFNKNFNIALKKIGVRERVSGRGGKIKITSAFPGIQTYWARHSWATIALNDCEISKDIISQALGHSMGNDITEIYIRRDERKVDAANRKVLDWVLYKKI